MQQTLAGTLGQAHTTAEVGQRRERRTKQSADDILVIDHSTCKTTPCGQAPESGSHAAS